MVETANVFAAAGQGRGLTVNVKVLDGGTYYGDQYLKLTFSTDFWGTRSYLPGRRGSLRRAPYNETHWPPDGLELRGASTSRPLAAPTTGTKRYEIIDEMQKLEYNEGGYIIPFFNNLLDAYSSKVDGLRAEQGHAEPRPVRPWLQHHLLRLAASCSCRPGRLAAARPSARAGCRSSAASGVHRAAGAARRARAVHRLDHRLRGRRRRSATRPARSSAAGDAREPRRAARAARPRPPGRLSSTATGSAASCTATPGDSFAGAGCRSATLIGERIVNSLFLVLLAALISIPLAIALGAVRRAAPRQRVRQRQLADHARCSRRMPEFVVGLVLVVLFATTVFHGLPAVDHADPPGDAARGTTSRR